MAAGLIPHSAMGGKFTVLSADVCCSLNRKVPWVATETLRGLHLQQAIDLEVYKVLKAADLEDCELVDDDTVCQLDAALCRRGLELRRERVLERGCPGGELRKEEVEAMIRQAFHERCCHMQQLLRESDDGLDLVNDAWELCQTEEEEGGGAGPLTERNARALLEEFARQMGEAPPEEEHTAEEIRRSDLDKSRRTPRGEFEAEFCDFVVRCFLAPSGPPRAARRGEESCDSRDAEESGDEEDDEGPSLSTESW